MNRTLTRIRMGSSLIGMICAVAVVAASAQAQTFPSRPVEFIAQSSAGGGTDLFSRSITDLLTKQKSFSQPLINANRVGGGGVVAYNFIKTKRGDPHFVMAIATGGVLNSASRPELELPLDIFTPLAMFATDPQVVAVRAESQYNVIAATGRGFSMPAAVPKEAAAQMEVALKRVYDSQAYKEYSHRNMFDNGYLDSAEFGKYLTANRVVHEEFLRALGVVK